MIFDCYNVGWREGSSRKTQSKQITFKYNVIEHYLFMNQHHGQRQNIFTGF